MANAIRDKINNGFQLLVFNTHAKLNELTHGRSDTVYYVKADENYNPAKPVSYTWNGTAWVILSQVQEDLQFFADKINFPSTGDIDDLYINNKNNYVYEWVADINDYRFLCEVSSVVVQLTTDILVKYNHQSVPKTQGVNLNTVYKIGFDGRSYLIANNKKYYISSSDITTFFSPTDGREWTDVYGTYTPPEVPIVSKEDMDFMQINKYDADNDGRVDLAKDTLRFGGKLPSYYTNLFDTANNKIDKKANQTDVDFRANIGKNAKAKTCMINFVSDDARVQDYTILLPIFSKYNVPVTTAVITNDVDNNDPTKCTLSQLIDFQNNHGWEICSHTKSHAHLTELSDVDLDSELKDSRQWLINKGFNGYDFIMYPYGYYDERVKRFTARYYKGGRHTAWGFNKTPFSSYALSAQWITNGTGVSSLTGYAVNTFEHFKGLIDYAVTNNLWLTIGMHSWEIDQWGYASLLDSIVGYAKSVAEIVTYKEAFNRLSNIIDQTSYTTQYDDHFVIAGDGKVSSNIGKTVLLAPNTLTINSLPSDLPEDTTSVCNITGTNTTGFPNNAAGTLISYKFQPTYSEPTNARYCWEEFIPYATSKKYIRYTATSTSWGSFTEVGGSQQFNIVSGGTYTGLSLLQDFPTSATTVTPVSDANAALGGLPITTGGTLTTHRVSTDPMFSYQTYRKYNSNYSWTRNASGLTTWGSWIRQTPITVTATTTQRNDSTFTKVTGEQVYDSTLGKPIYWNGTVWKDYAGATV